MFFFLKQLRLAFQSMSIHLKIFTCGAIFKNDHPPPPVKSAPDWKGRGGGTVGKWEGEIWGHLKIEMGPLMDLAG